MPLKPPCSKHRPRPPHRRRQMWLLRNCRGGRSCAPLHAGLEAARLKHLAAEALRAGGAAGCGFQRSARRGGGRIKRPPQQAKRPPQQAVRSPRTRRSPRSFSTSSARPSAAAWLKKTADPLAAQRLAASVIRDGDRLDGRSGGGGDAPAVAGARTRLVA